MRRRQLAHRAAQGFSLIEVIVALVVISGFGAALFVWAGQTLQTASRAAQVQQEVEIERNITELAFSLNPATRPSGELKTATHRYQWTSTPAKPLTDQPRAFFGSSPWQVGVWMVRFTVTDLEDAQSRIVSDRRVAGYVQARPRQSGPPGFAGVPSR
jgi:prepilin-type N-terminal cleavage/methylation domain-containing protein